MDDVRQPLFNERIAIVGKTGSGKTWGAAVLTKPIKRLLVIDSKHSEGLDAWGLEEWAGPVAVRPVWHKIITKGIDDYERRLMQQQAMLNGHNFRYRFKVPHTWNTYKHYENLWRWVWDNFQGKGITLYIDELYLTLRGNPNGGTYLNALYTQGREKKIGTWASMQRPSRIPLICLSESEWIFQFRLSLENDRKRMKEIMGPDAMQSLQGHQFLVYNQEWDKPEIYDDIGGQ